MNLVETYHYVAMVQAERLHRARINGWALNVQRVRQWLSAVEKWTGGKGRVYLETTGRDPSRTKARLEAYR
jgi:hypothetical protein